MRKTVVVVGIGLAVFFIAVAVAGVVPWQVAGILASASVGVATLLLTYESKKDEKQ